jgi:hypothetical protein
MRLVLALLLLSACKQVKKDNTVCPEYRDLRCLSGTQCSMDADRGCRVCRCDDGDKLTEPVDDNSRPPDSNPYAD